ncbi:hypothetical protein C8N47_10399 [Mangrovibacterium marinum]|uniref:Fasciclin domain-containing protein n=1 Tax=Mangrovibacterium marinum TaxID=1639118 RepID=A0A2T5C4K1_9BACT|nr:hypothetical protein C8N47_10399 [Mangrovibacterium marinum]
MLLFATACTDEKWDDHYQKNEIVVDNLNVEIVDQTIEEYISSQDDYSIISQLFDETEVYSSIESRNQSLTVFVYKNATINENEIIDRDFFAKTCVCDLGLTPTKISDGFSLLLWTNKFTRIRVDELGDVFIGDVKLERVVQTKDGFVYEMASPMVAPPSLYEVLNSLGDDYSVFRSLIAEYEEKVFDRENSTPIGVDNTGNTVYDSTFVVTNSLMDRYSDYNATNMYWNMREEQYTSTMMIINNDLVENALDQAYAFYEEAFGTIPSSEDTTRFKEWIIRSAFFDYELSREEVTGDVDLWSVRGKVEGIYDNYYTAQWRPSVQLVDAANPVKFSNGVGYYVTDYKIPNNFVIWRYKEFLAGLWERCSDEEKDMYFKNNSAAQSIRSQGGFGPFGEFPLVKYDILRMDPISNGEHVAEDGDPAYVELTGVTYDAVTNTIKELNVPPGEYYLRWGAWSANAAYTADFYFNGELVRENQGFQGWCNFDRYGAAEFPYGFFDRHWRVVQDGKAAYYNRDGQNVATVIVKESDNPRVKIRLESTDIFKNSDGSYKDASQAWGLFHWCLRPTENNY